MLLAQAPAGCREQHQVQHVQQQQSGGNRVTTVGLLTPHPPPAAPHCPPTLAAFCRRSPDSPTQMLSTSLETRISRMGLPALASFCVQSELGWFRINPGLLLTLLNLRTTLQRARCPGGPHTELCCCCIRSRNSAYHHDHHSCSIIAAKLEEGDGKGSAVPLRGSQ